MYSPLHYETEPIENHPFGAFRYTRAILDLRDQHAFPITIILPDGTETTFADIFTRLALLEAAIAPKTHTSRVEYNLGE